MLKCYFVNIMKRAETVKKFNCVCLKEENKRKMKVRSGVLDGWRLALWVWLYAAEPQNLDSLQQTHLLTSFYIFFVMSWVSLPFIALYHSPVYVSTCEPFSLMDQLT
jgi:hypothetical protein